VDGVRGYAAFAPPGWRPPSLLDEVESVRRLLPDPGVWCLVAEVRGELVGQVMVLPAARAAHPDDDPALGHLRNLFVREDRWGTGVAAALHAAAVEAARGRGFTALRLFAAAGQGPCAALLRARGLDAARCPAARPGSGLEVVEYRLDLLGRCPRRPGSGRDSAPATSGRSESPRYARLPSPGQVEDVGRKQRLAVVGYGVQDFAAGGGPPQAIAPFTPLPPRPSSSCGPGRPPRRRVHQGHREPLAGQGGTCFGDSGGPCSSATPSSPSTRS
jgi:GNAT superfamily N-acetyltransferase